MTSGEGGRAQPIPSGPAAPTPSSTEAGSPTTVPPTPPVGISFLRRFDAHTHELVRGASLSFVARIVGGALSFVFNVALARALGAGEAGRFALALTVATIASVFGRVGLDNVLVRFIASHAAMNEWAIVKGVFNRSLRVAIAASAAATVSVVLLAPTLADTVFHKPDLVGPIRLMSLSILPFVILMLVGEALKGLKLVFASAMVQVIIASAVAVVGVTLFGRHRGLPAAIWSYSVGCLVAAVVGLVVWVRATPKTRGLLGRFSSAELIRSGIPLFWVATMSVAMSWMGTLALGIWGTKEEVGIFAAAYRTAYLISFVLVAVNSIAGAQFATLYRSGDRATLAATVRNSTKLMILWAAPVTLLFVLAPSTVMRIFGRSFTVGGAALAILSIGQFLNVAAGSMGKLLMMTGHERATRNIVAVTAFINVALTVILVPRYHIVGAAIAAAAGLGIQNLLAVWTVNRVLAIRPGILRT